MKTTLHCLVLAAFLGALCGCGKSKPEPVKSESVVVTTPAGPVDLADVDKALAQKDFDAAVAVIAKVQPQFNSMTEEQRVQLSQTVQKIMTALQDVKYNDPKAMDAYKRLGRITTGR